MKSAIIYLALLGALACQEKQQRIEAIKEATPVVAANDGDTVKKSNLSMSVDELKKFLPEVEGFKKKEDATGETAHTGKSGSRYYSYARQQYTKNNIDYYVEIIDYKEDLSTFNGLLHMYGFDTVLNNNALYTRPEKLPSSGNIKALATIYKNEPEIKLTIAVNERFIINCGAFGDTLNTHVKKLANSIKLKELTKL